MSYDNPTPSLAECLAWLCSLPITGSRLANIVCALRGPDDNNHDLKSKLTSPIRNWVLHTAQSRCSLGQYGFMPGNDAPTTEEGWRELLNYADHLSLESPGGSHYLDHITHAIKAILVVEHIVKHEPNLQFNLPQPKEEQPKDESDS